VPLDRSQNLLSDLMPPGVGLGDLQSVLTHHFGGALYLPDRLACFYPVKLPYALRLQFDKAPRGRWGIRRGGAHRRECSIDPRDRPAPLP